MDEPTTITDVIDSPSPAVEAPESEGAVSAPADVQGESQTPEAQSKEEAAAPFLVPENDDDLKGQENNPHVPTIIQMRKELRERDQRLDSYKPLDDWKPLVETVGDPQLAQQAYELVTAIHSPDEANPSGFTTRPFLEQMEQQSAGTLNQIYADILSFPITDEQGQPTTVVREAFKGWGLDPDRIDDYRNIDTLRASGVVTQEELGRIDAKYHEAFKSLPRDAQEDILALKETNPSLAEVHLRNAERAMASERWEKQQADRDRQAQEQEARAFEQHVTQAVEADVLAKVKSWSDSIHQNLSSQWKPSSDEAQNNLEYAKVLSTLATLQHPGYRFVAENALKAVGASVEGFDELINQWQAARSAYVVHTERKDAWQARREEAKATQAEQRILIKLNDYALKLAQVSGSRLQSQATQTTNQLAAAAGRFVPAGNGSAQQGFENPYAQNPHPVGSQEYYAFNRKIDREYNLTGASMFGG